MISLRASTAISSASTSTSRAAARCSSTASSAASLAHRKAPLFAEARRRRRKSRALYESREFGKALREVMRLADARQPVRRRAEALGARQAGRARRAAAEVCSTALNLFRLLTLYLKPVLPQTAAQAERFLRVPPLAWQDAAKLLPAGTASTNTGTCSAASTPSSSTRCSSRGRAARQIAAKEHSVTDQHQHRRLQQARPACRAHRARRAR